MNENTGYPMDERVVQQPPEPKKGHRTLWITLGVIGGVLILCIVAAVIIGLVFDPWGIVARLRGTYDPIAQAVPPDTQMFMNVDFLQLQSEDLINLINVFLKATGQDEITDYQKLIEEMDETIEPETDMTFAGDVLPWVGQFAGLGINDLQGTFSAAGVEDADLYLIVEVRDKKKADEFLVKVMDKYREENDQGFIEHDYEGTTIYEVDTQYEDERLAFGRSGNLLILSTKIATLKEVIDTKKADSLADTEEYKQIVAALPKGRLLTFYMSFAFLESFYDELDLPTNLETNAQLEMLGGMGMAISAVDVGLQMDYVMAYNLDQMTEEQRASMQIEPGQPMTASLFPQETYLYITSEHLDRSLETLQQGLVGLVEEEEIEEAMGIFEQQFGINPQTDLFPYLDGEYAIGIFESSEGMLAEQLGVPISLLLVIESSDQAALLNAAEKIAQGLEGSGQFNVLQTESNGIQFFELQDPYYQESAIVYAVKEDILLISLDTGTIEEVYGDRLSLDQYTRYKEGWNAFPKDMRPIFYIDVEGIYGFVTEDLGELTPTEVEEADFLKPIKTIEAASRIIDENLMHSTFIVFVEGESTQ